FSMIYIALQKEINQNELELIHKREAQDISLCLLSLLQNSIIEIDRNDTEKASLILNSNDGYLFLYSIIYSDVIDKQLKESGFNPNADSSLFALPTISSNISHIKVQQTNRNKPKFYET